MGPFVQRPLYVAGFLLLLGGAQVRALAEQFRRGYRPFAHAPVRVPLSWDMFSTEISRCDVTWTPPLDVDGRRLARLRDTGQPLEWDPVYDRVADYRAAARAACYFQPPSGYSTLRCFTAEGRATQVVERCR